MKAFSFPGVLGAATLACGALLFAGCSQNTQAVSETTSDTTTIAGAPQPETATSETTANETAGARKSATKTAKTASAATSGAKGKNTKQKAAAKSIAWQPTLVAAMNLARTTHKPIMADFFATWCGPCKHLDENIYTAPAVISESKNFICVKIDVDQNRATAQQYQIGPIPTIIFMDGSGTELVRYEGAPAESDLFLQWMQDAHTKSAGTPA